MTNWKKKRFERYVFEFLIAIELIMSFTFLGYIHVPPISIATAYIPIVIIGCIFGPWQAGIAGLIFGLESLYKASAYYVVCPAKLDHTSRCKSGHGNRQ